MGYVIDRSGEPFVVIRFDGVVDDATFQRYLDEYDALVDAGRVYTLVFDARRADAGSSKQRRMQAEMIERRKADLQRLCAGAAFVVTSPLVRASMSVILFFSPLPFPHLVTQSYEEAEAWARERLPTTP